MRQVIVQVEAGRGGQVQRLAAARGATNQACWAAEGADGPCDVVLLHLPNHEVGPLIDALDEAIGGARVSLLPQGAFALRPPPDEAPQQVLDVQPRSPLEIFLSGLQSVGSWKGFLGFAAAAGAVVWLGLLTGTWYLLTAAMLIAPFASPAMNAAVAAARGDGSLLLRSLGRYAASLATTIGVGMLLTWVIGPEAPTEMMRRTASISNATALLPLVAGAAGALHLAQSERSSLVSAAGTGMLVAASLAPPAGVVAMGLVLGEWILVRSGFFLLLLQIAGIQLAGALVFRLVGLSAKGARFPAGRKALVPIAFVGAAAAFTALLFWQLGDPPALQRASVVSTAQSLVARELRGADVPVLLETRIRFPQSGGAGNRLLTDVWVLAGPDEAPGLEERIAALLRRELDGVQPLVQVHRLQP
ncbi:DUF389 domain-containing protein [Vulgatibacter sp.]|uniref:DUF389 domain-containing protein n=1 Tax=Vulgatibacter sp. TaxID=1971226 RepID=UPI003565F254